MGLVITRRGAANLLERALNNGEALTLRLFKNNLSPGESTAFAEFTEPDESASGYDAIDLLNSAPNWTVTEGDLTTRSYATYAQQTFSFTGSSGTIYGYFITDDSTSDPTVVWAERFSSSEAYFDGKDIKVTPRIELSTRVD